MLALALMLEGYRGMANAPASTQCGQLFGQYSLLCAHYGRSEAFGPHPRSRHSRRASVDRNGWKAAVR